MYVQMPPLGQPSGRNEDPNDVTNPLNAVPTSSPASPLNIRLNIPFTPPHPPLHPHQDPLASRNRRPRHDITRRHRPIKLKQQPRVRRLVRPRETDQLPSRLNPARPAGDLDLRTAQIQLRPAHTPRRMQRNVLHAKQVLAVLDALGDLHAYLLFACPTVSINPPPPERNGDTNQRSAK